MDPNSLLPNISDSNRSLNMELLPVSSTFGASTGVSSMPYNQVNQMDCYEDMFKEITKKLYGDEGLGDVPAESASGIGTTSIIYDPDVCRSSDAMALLTPGNGFPQGTIVLQRRPVDDKSAVENVAVTVSSAPNSVVEERWFDSEEALSWTTSKIAKYNPVQKVFRCADCDFVGFISRVAEHWLGNHASLRVFQCPKCSYTSAWARCVRMHLTRQHGETVSDNSVWKENPVLEEVTKFLNSLKAKVDQKHESNDSGAKKYTCPYCPYATDRRDLFNRHENIHRDDKPFQCYICDKQFNRADHVKKHFSRMHREEDYDMNKVRKVLKPGLTSDDQSGKINSSIETDNSMTGEDQSQDFNIADTSDGSPEFDTDSLSSAATPVKMDALPASKSSATPKQSKVVVKKKKPNEKMYSCSYCPWQGVDNWCLKRHLNTHIKPFLCVLCDYKAARSERLATHVLKVHNKRICLKCVSFLADNLEALHKHIQEKHQNPTVKTGYSCNVCHEYFELRADLEAHAILDHQKVIVQCDLCDFRTTDEISMEAHLREKHDLQPGMGAVAAAAAAAAAVSTHTSIKEGVQDKDITHAIGATAGSTARTEKPEKTDLKKPSSVRSKTEIALPTNSHLTASIDLTQPVADMGHNISIAAEGSTKTVGQENRKDKFTCGSCGCSLDSENSLGIHERMHLDGLQHKNTQELSRSYMCSTCSFTCATRMGIVSHLRTHTGFSARCFAKNCQYSTPFEQSLKEHVALEHNPKSATGHIVCPHCGYGISSMNLFAAHWRLHHRSLCSLCVNVYKVRYDLKEADIYSIMTPLEIEDSEASFENIDGDVESESSELPLPPESQNTTEAVASPTKKYSTKELKAYKTFKRAFDSYSKRRNENLDFLPKLLEVQILPVLVNKSVVKGRNYAKKVTRKFYQGRTYSVTQLPSFRYQEPKTLRRSEYNKCVLTNRANSIGCKRCFYPKCKRRVFRSTASFSSHILWSHTRKKTFFCDICGNHFVHLYQVLIHKLKKHKSENLYQQAPEFSLTPDQMMNGFVDQMIPL